MKKAVDLNIGEKTYTLMFNTHALAQVERKVNFSLTQMMSLAEKNPVAVTAHAITIDFAAAALDAGLQDKPKDFDAYDFIDMFCADGGTLADLQESILKAMVYSCCFTKGTQERVDEMVKQVEAAGL